MNENNWKELSLKVPREIIADLLPLYMSGEASPPTCALVEEYLGKHPELRTEVDLESLDDLKKSAAATSPPTPELQLRSLQRTRALIRWQRLAYGWALAFSVASLGGVGSIQNGHASFHFFFGAYPAVFIPCVSIAVSLWANYFFLRWRLRSR